jgi:hypothetical protein
MSITTSSVYGIHLACAHPAKPADHQKTLHEDFNRVLVLLRHCRAVWIFVLVVCAISASFAQGSKRPADDPIEDRDRDHPNARAEWFMRGRTAPDGESAAMLRYRAFQQKLQLRKSKLSARAVAAVPHVVSSGWVSRGPAPLASDATGDGSQDYGAVSGRATAIAVDPADSTGNTLYIGGAYGGVWKSSNAASPDVASVTWQPVLDHAETLAVGAIAIQPGNTDPTRSLILVGTGEPNSSADSYYGLGILRSTDSGQTWEPIIKYADGGSRSFVGMGFSKIAFNSTPGRTNVVVAATGAAATGISMGLDPTGVNRGLYYSTDSGQTWSYATVQDAGATVSPASATSVVYNQATGSFFAALRYHGIYSSTDGITWSRLSNQPAGLLASLCPASTSYACPIYRAELAVAPGRNEMYTWVVSFDSAGNEVDRGIWLTSNGGGNWKPIADPGITDCGDGVDSGCGVQQGSYNLGLAAVPNGATATDLYAGAVNIYKCTVAAPTAPFPGCTFLNLTHVYGCSPASALAHVHPDQHALAFALAGTPTQSLMYFANDGGVYRALDGYTGLTTGSCTGHNLFDNLNGTLGSMTQFVSFSMHPTDANTLLGGTQDNGSPATVSATSSTGWGNVLGGDGGYNAISPVNGTDWFAANPDVPPNSLNIQYCNAGFACNDKRFTQVVTSADVGTDDGSFYFPYILDPKAPTQLVIGTCRVWRGGPATSPTGTYNALSKNLDSGAETACTGRETNLVRSLAAGGPSDADGSRVVYAGTEGAGAPTNPAGGRVFVTQDASTTLMTDVTGDINPSQYPISAVALDPADQSGRTAFVTVMGFGVEVGHVFKTTDAGTTWTNFSGSTDSLPDAPANSVIVDSNTVFVGTDVGVFASDTSSPSWTEVGPRPAPAAYGFLPNVPVTALRIFNSGGKKLLRASTYGRGIWEYDLIAAPDYHVTVLPSTWTLFPTQTKLFDGTLTALNGYSSQVTLSCTGTGPQTCTPNPNLVEWTTPPVATFKITATGPIGDYQFNVHAVGSDPANLTHDATVTLRVVDFAISALAPATLSVAQGATSTSVTFQVTALGSFGGTVALACSTGLPAGTTCNFSPSSVSSFPANIELIITAQASAPVGQASVTISATTQGAPGPKSRILALTVTPPVPDYVLAISNTPLSANVNQPGIFNGTLKALNGYNTAVNLSCGTSAPPTCTVAPSSLVPTVAGAPFTVTVQSNEVKAYNFNINGTGTDAGHLARFTSVAFSSAFTFTLSDSTSAQSVKAGQSANYSLTVTPGSGTFPSAVTFACAPPTLPAGAACSFSPAQINGGASGPQTVALTISTAGPNSAMVHPAAQRTVAPFFLWLAATGIVSVGLVHKTSGQKKSILLLVQCLLIPSLIGLLSCGGGITDPGTGGGGGGSISVSISPRTSNLFPTQQQQFSASVSGSTNTQVSWQVNGATGGTPAGGNIDPNGLYTAPTIVPNSPTVTVSAISQADVTKSASATVAIQSSTPSGTFTISITAAVGTSTQTTTATLTVQ